MKMQTRNHHSHYHQSVYRNEDLIEVYKDTLLKATNYHLGTTEIIRNYSDLQFKNCNGEVLVENIDSVGALVKYGVDTEVAILNMASAKTPGGGVIYGAKAQEESLFRCSNLGLSISRFFYPLDIDEILISRNIVFFKDKDYRDLEYAYGASVITCAAPKLDNNTLEWYRDDYDAIIDMKIQNILKAGVFLDANVLILGAWGCGVYKNDPHYIANKFKKFLVDDGYRNWFDKVIFAVINDQNSVGNNYEIFKSILG